MSKAFTLPLIRVVLLKGHEMKIRNPDLASDTKKLVAGPEDLVLDAVEADVRGNLWIRFLEHRGLGLPMGKGIPNIRKAWDDEDINIFRITPTGEEEYFSD